MDAPPATLRPRELERLFDLRDLEWLRDRELFTNAEKKDDVTVVLLGDSSSSPSSVTS